MFTENINITTTKERFFLEYLILKKPAIDSMLRQITGDKKATLSDMPMRVLSQILYFNDQYRDLPDKDRFKYIFSKTVKELICNNLNMREHHLNIYISQLRHLGILDGKTIKPIFIILADDRSLTFTFKLNGHTIKTN
jgi:hypothetical protein